MKTIKIICTLALITFITTIRAQTFSYNFTTGYEGWTGDFSDYPVTDSIFYELEFTRTTLPAPLSTCKHALKISGNNHSDDLFMFIKRKITGLLPNTTYQLFIDVEFASNAPTNASGVGGAPGESVTVKAGATLIEPLKINSDGFYLMNIDKSNQTEPGSDMDTIGHVGVSDTTEVFTLISRNNNMHPFVIETDANGEVWVCIGTDSGFEATTTLYYNQIDLTFTTTETSLNASRLPQPNGISIYPNPSSEVINVTMDPAVAGQVYTIADMQGKIILTGKLTAGVSAIPIHELPKGMYLFKIGEQTKQLFKVIKK